MGLSRIIYFDTETTGLNPRKDRVIELALFIIENGVLIEKYDHFINVGFELPSKITELTGISDDMLRSDGLSERIVAKDLMLRLKKDTLMVAHNCQFDLNFIYFLLIRYYKKSDVEDLFGSMFWLDTLTIFKDRKAYPHKLIDLVDYYNLGDVNFHRAIDDTSVLPKACVRMNQERGDVLKYVNVFGYNPKYGVTGKRFSFIKYVRQSYHDGMVDSKDILPLKIK